jgi:hypothetical protein
MRAESWDRSPGFPRALQAQFGGDVCDFFSGPGETGRIAHHADMTTHRALQPCPQGRDLVQGECGSHGRQSQSGFRSWFGREPRTLAPQSIRPGHPKIEMIRRRAASATIT